MTVLMSGLICDVCRAAVVFEPRSSTYDHQAATICQGLDGVVLGAARENGEPAPSVPER